MSDYEKSIFHRYLVQYSAGTVPVRVRVRKKNNDQMYWYHTIIRLPVTQNNIFYVCVRAFVRARAHVCLYV